MRVLFVNFNNKMSQSKDFLVRLKAQQNVTNLACMANIVMGERHLSKIVDYDIENIENEQILKEFEAYKPHVIVAHLEDSVAVEQLKYLKFINDQNNSVKLIVHNNYLYHMPIEEFLMLPVGHIDVVLREEPEDSLPKIFDALFGGYSMKKISNVRYQTEGRIWKQTDSVFFNHLDLTSFAYRKSLKNDLYKNITGDKPMAVIKATRGSCFDCTYNNINLLEGEKIRYRTPESIAREIESCYKEYGITEFYLETEYFNFENWWAKDVTLAIRNISIPEHIHIMTKMHLKDLDKSLLEEMQFTGFNCILLNLCSGSDETLKRARVGITSTKYYKENIKLLNYFGMYTYAIYRIGFPWEMKKHISETIKLISEFNHTYLDFKILSPEYNCAIVEQFREIDKLGEFKNLIWEITGTKYMKRSELESQYKQFELTQKLFGKLKKEKVRETLYTLTEKDKKALRRKTK